MEQHLLRQHSEINDELDISCSMPASSPVSAMKGHLFTVELIRTKSPRLFVQRPHSHRLLQQLPA